MTKTERKRLLRLCEAVLVARRNGNVKYEQIRWERVAEYCGKFGVDPGDAMEQAITFLMNYVLTGNWRPAGADPQESDNSGLGPKGRNHSEAHAVDMKRK